jgi:hypothetical protein
MAREELRNLLAAQRRLGVERRDGRAYHQLIAHLGNLPGSHASARTRSPREWEGDRTKGAGNGPVGHSFELAHHIVTLPRAGERLGKYAPLERVVERHEKESRAPLAVPVIERRLAEHGESTVADREAAAQKHPAAHAPAEPAECGAVLPAAHFAQCVTPRKLHMMQMNVPHPAQG